jgi:hypothetical protein
VLSIATWPAGSHSTLKMASGLAGINRCTSNLSTVIELLCHG